MKIANNKLIQMILSSWINSNKFVDILYVLSKLSKKYGKMLFDQRYQKQINSIDKNLWNVINILNLLNKTKYDDIKNLILLIKRVSPDYVPQFSVISDSKNHNQMIQKHIKEKFSQSEIQLKDGKSDWLYVSWEGRYYKKDLDSDLKKILEQQF